MLRPVTCLASGLRLWLLVVAGLLPAQAAELHSSLPSAIVPESFGVNIHFTDPKPGELEMLTEAGFKWVRTDLTWAETERTKGQYDFSAYDRLTAALALSHEIEQPPVGPVAEGIASVHIRYEFAAGWKSLRMVNPTWPPPGEKNLLGQPTSLSVWIYGDGQGATAHLRFVDSSGQFFQSDGPRVDWKGWRQVTFPMLSRRGKRLENWGGADDGQIHYPIELDSILVLENAGREPLSGQIYVSAPVLNFDEDRSDSLTTVRR